MNKEIEELLKHIREQLMIDEEFGAKDFHKTTLNYKEVKLLLSYIEQLEKKIDQYENPDDLTLFYMWLDTKAKDKMKQLEKRNKELYEGFMATQEELTDYATKNEQLENNRDKAIEKLVIKQLRYLNEPKYKLTTLDLEEIKNILKGDSDNEQE